MLDSMLISRLNRFPLKLRVPSIVNMNNKLFHWSPALNSQFSYGRSRIFSSNIPKTFIVDKSPFIKEYEKLGIEGTLPPAILSCAPKRFGKSTFIDLLEKYYDFKTPDTINTDCFNYPLQAWKDPSPLKGKFHVMKLEFGSLLLDHGAKLLTPDLIDDVFVESLRKQCRTFLDKYGYQKREFKYAVQLFEYCIETAHREAVKLNENQKLNLQPRTLILIDEYDTIPNAFYMQDSLDKNEKRLMLMKGFYSKLKVLASTDDICSVFITGIAPLALHEFSMGFNIAQTLQDFAGFSALYGFSEEDVKQGMKKVGDGILQEGEFSKAIEILRKYHNGYLFQSDAGEEERVFNPTRILHVLSLLERYCAVNKSRNVVKFLEETANSLDPNSRPASDTLSQLSKMNEMDDILKELLQNGDRSVVLQKGNLLTRQLKYSDLIDLGASHDTLVTYLYHTGMLTYGKKDESGRQLFTVPNQIAWMDVFADIERRLRLNEGDLERFKKSLDILRCNNDLGPFVEGIQTHFMKYYKGHNSQVNEPALDSTFFSMLSVAKKSEDVVDKSVPMGKAFEGKQKEIDCKLEMGRKLFFFEFKALLPKYLSSNILGRTKFDGKWSSEIELSSELLKYSEDKLLKTKWKYPIGFDEDKDKYIIETCSVKDHIVRWKQETKFKYEKEILKQGSQKELVKAFLVVRVGTFRTIFREIDLGN